MPIAPILATIACIAIFIWECMSFIASRLQWPTWTPVAMTGAVFAAVIVAGLMASLVSAIQVSRERRQHAEMEARYPHCHVTRLSSGKWFLTDRSTGREIRATDTHSCRDTTRANHAPLP
jgi:hypothetical protein